MDNHPKYENITDVSAFMLDWLKQFNNDEQIETLEVELTNVTGTYLHHLNDDCLLEIFSSKSLNLMDLCSLAKTCERFRQITQRIIPKELSVSRGFKKAYEFKARSYAYETSTRKDVVRIFKSLGSFLSALSIKALYSIDDNFFVLNLVANHCVENLDSLTVYYARFPEALALKMKPIFKRLKLLDMDRVSFAVNTTLFVELNSLIELRMDHVDASILENITFPKLKKFIYFNYIDSPEGKISNIFSPFLSRHKGLKTIDIQEYGYEYDKQCIMVILQTIGDSCTELEELSIKIGELCSSTHLQPLKSLNLLKILELRRLTCEDLKLFSYVTELRELSLTSCCPPIDVNQFASLTQLTKLRMSFCSSCHWSVVVNIISKLVNLEELTIYRTRYLRNDFVLDELLLSQVVDIYKRRQNVLMLRCRVDYYVNYRIRKGENFPNLILRGSSLD